MKPAGPLAGGKATDKILHAQSSRGCRWEKRQPFAGADAAALGRHNGAPTATNQSQQRRLEVGKLVHTPYFAIVLKTMAENGLPTQAISR